MKKYFVTSFFIHSCVFALVTFFSFNPEWFPLPPLPMVKPEARPNLITFSIEETSAVADSSAPGFVSSPSKATFKIKGSKIKHQAPQFNSKVNSHLHQGNPAYSGPTNNSPSYSDPTHFDDIDNINDIAMPELAQISSEDLGDSTHSSLRFDEIKKSFDEIDNEDSKKIVAVNDEFEQLSSEELASIDKQSDTIKEQNASLDSLVSKRKSELAQEKSNLGIQRQKAKVASNASGESSFSSFGRGKAGQISGGNQNGAGGTGTTGEIRKLEDLRQVPGNLKPEYDTEDRVQGLSGNIVVYGYVTKSGSISSFKLIQSTGHRSLDQKTLNALKRWRFYPGQDGWVELPFKWDLKGGVQQKPTLLKRQ